MQPRAHHRLHRTLLSARLILLVESMAYSALFFTMYHQMQLDISDPLDQYKQPLFQSWRFIPLMRTFLNPLR